MTLDDLPEFREEVEKFEKSAASLIATVEQYERHGISMFTPREIFTMQKVLKFTRQSLGISVDQD